jgi:hypothetical protein
MLDSGQVLLKVFKIGIFLFNKNVKVFSSLNKKC